MDTKVSVSFLFMLILCGSSRADDAQSKNAAHGFETDSNNENTGINKEYISSLPIIHSKSSNSVIEKRSVPQDFLQEQDARNENINEQRTPTLYYFLQPLDTQDDGYPLSEIFNKRRVPPLGFYNGRGKKDGYYNNLNNENGNQQYFDEDPTSSQFLEEKRRTQMPMPFYAVRGKKQSRPFGFVAMRGKRAVGSSKGYDDFHNEQFWT